MATPKNPEVAPAALDATSKALWKLTVAQLKEQKTWQVSDVPLLHRYVLSMEVARLARERINAREKFEPGSGYTAHGSQGQLVQHPDLKTARDAERDAQVYASDLLLSPRARQQHDIKIADGRSSRLAAILNG